MVINADVCREGATVLTVTENGYGKRTALDEYKVQNRAGKGVTGYKLTEKTGLVAGFKVVDENDDLMVITSEGIIIRTAISEISEFGRVTQGVRVMRLDEGVKVVSIERTEKEEDEEEQADQQTVGEATENTEATETTEAVETTETIE